MMILVNTDYISGKELEMLGMVKGSTIQSKNLGRDITQGFKTLVGGECAPSKGYSVSWVEIPFGKSLANSPIASLGYLVATLWY